MSLLQRWALQKDDVNGEDREKLESEAEANRSCLENAHWLKVNGLVVTVDGTVQGYTFGKHSNNDVFTVFFEKTNPMIRGLSVFIFSEFAKQSGCKLINAGEDWDVGYLKESKMSYHPHIIHKSYSLVRQT